MWRSAVQVCLGLHIGDKSNVLKAEKPGKDAQGGLAQLARALAWHARGHRFDPDILHLSGITHIYSVYHLSRDL